MPPRDFNDGKYWRNHAGELRLLADGYTDKAAAAIARQLADDYDKIADRAEERARRREFGSIASAVSTIRRSPWPSP
jgi:hypothetical protein